MAYPTHRRWLDRTQPQTLYMASMLLYINAAFEVIGLLGYGMSSVGSLGPVSSSARSPRPGGSPTKSAWGSYLGVAMAFLPNHPRPQYTSRSGVNLLFMVALVALLLHRRSHEYRRSGSSSPYAGPGHGTTIDGIDGLRAAVGSTLGTSPRDDPGPGQPLRRRHRRPSCGSTSIPAARPGSLRRTHRPRLPRPVAGPALLFEMIQVDGVNLVVDYGLNKARFPAPVPVGSKVRLVVGLAAVEDVAGRVSRPRST